MKKVIKKPKMIKIQKTQKKKNRMNWLLIIFKIKLIMKKKKNNQKYNMKILDMIKMPLKYKIAFKI